jgi:hypothetical protein
MIAPPKPCTRADAISIPRSAPGRRRARRA